MKHRKASLKRSTPVSRANQVVPRLQNIGERRNGTVQTTGIGVFTGTFALDPAVLITAARLAGYQAVADEVRLDSIVFNYVPHLGSTAGGRLALYIDRDPAAAAVATVSAAKDQREVVSGCVRDHLSLTWRPQEPDDRQFNLLNPGTTSLGSFVLIGDALTDAGVALPNGTIFGTTEYVVRMTLRGRP